MIKEGGILTYSTCSLNPIENEAVVSAALLKFKGEIELIECRDILGSFKTRKGLTTWKVCDDADYQTKRRDLKKLEKKIENEEELEFNEVFKVYSSFEEVPTEKKEKIRPTMFQPLTPAEMISELKID